MPGSRLGWTNADLSSEGWNQQGSRPCRAFDLTDEKREFLLAIVLKNWHYATAATNYRDFEPVISPDLSDLSDLMLVF
jgi:hypothetical protein